MLIKNKLIIVEAEMTEPKGHFLNNLIDISKFFEKKLNIYWLLNKNFHSNNTFIPKKPKIIKAIKSNKFNRKENKLAYIFEEIYLFFFNILLSFYFLFFFAKEKKLKNYILALKSNYFLLPRYFSSFYNKYKDLKLSREDSIFFPSARRKDIALVNFLTKIDLDHPKFHLRVFLMPKVRFKGFFYYLKQINNKSNNAKVFIYLWNNKNYKIFKNNSYNKDKILISKLIFSYNPFSKFDRKYKKKNYVIGFAGNARRARGFHRLPKLIELLERQDNSFKYLIHFSNISKDLIPIKNQLYNLSKKNNKIKIINKYTNNLQFINILKKIDIMPLLHNAKEINNVTSGTIYSCLPYQIPFIIPNGSNFMEDINKFKSYEKGKNLDQIAKKTIKISKKYPYYLKNAKLNFKLLKNVLDQDPLKINLL